MIVYSIRIDRFKSPFTVGKTNLTAGLCEHGDFCRAISAGKPPFFRQINALIGYFVLYKMRAIN
jgi:hypothetical protein